MNARNPVYTADGRIDCEIEHPAYGWIPTTLAADDPDTADLFATVSQGDVTPAPAPDLDATKAARRAAMEDARKAAEAEGVTVNGIRYAGDPSNRQALAEALDMADDTAQTTFASWLDSDGAFHADHPVADVREAYLAIGRRRSDLIAKQGTKVAAITAATTIADVEAITWTS